ncbi:MAG: ATP-binding protein [Pseudomonadota bacterium]
MLLRIIDLPAENDTQDAVRVVLENNNHIETFVTESYTSSISDNFRKTLAWYFTEYPQQTTKDDSGVVEKLIKFGQYMGDEILGEDHQLMKIKSIIEAQGYQNLQVQIESTRLGFFKEMWETTILPESKYVLSAVVQGFVRQFVQESFPADYPELRYDLKVKSQPDKVAQLLRDDLATAGNDIQIKNQKPLRILYVASRPATLALSFPSSNIVSQSLAAISAGGVIEYEVHAITDWERLQERLKDKNKPVHIFHYDGPVILEKEVASFVFVGTADITSLVGAHDLAKALVNNKVGVLCVDARNYLQNGQRVAAEDGLAAIALSAHRHGLGNVVGLAQITDPWTSGQCFKSVYARIAGGLSLAQAVVEARKALQSAIETSLATVKPIPFHRWSLLVHYGRQSVTFFEAPQTFIDTDDLQGLKLFQEKLFGFRANMLPPLLNQVGDGHLVSVIDQLLIAHQDGTSQAVSIIGEPGTGKSQLAHMVSLYLAEKRHIDYGFYFNFTEDFYTPHDMLEMIAPILDLKIDQRIEAEARLMQLHCCFVLDNIDSKQEARSEKEISELHESTQILNIFLQKLLAFGHIVIVAGESFSKAHELAAIKITTSPLLFIEQKIIAANSVRQLNLTEPELTGIGQNQDWDNLLIQLGGHPWLTKKVIPLLRSYGARDLIAEVKQLDPQKSKVEQFYEWQWASLKPVWQTLLIVCSDVQGLLLEILMTAADQKESFVPARNLFALLGDDEVKFGTGLDVWESAGFLNRLAHGRMIDSRALPFLVSKRETCFKNIDQQKLQLYFSQLLCEGIRLLAQHVIKQPNPMVSNNLLINRRHWVKHFENLWFSHDYRHFFAVKNAFDQLLQQVKLLSESKVWTLDLLERSPFTAATEAIDIEASLSWLALASSVLDQTEARDSQCIAEGVEVWRSWFNGFEESDDRQQLALFQQVTIFLEKFYQNNSKWHDAIAVCEKACAIYTQHDAWQRVIQSLKSLAKYYYELGDKEQTLMLETRIIKDIPYAAAPPGFQTQQMLDILLARVARTDTVHAQVLLDELKKAEAAEKFAHIFDGVQCDIYYQEGNYLAALPFYCKIWASALQSNQLAQIEQMKSRMIELENKIGSENFNKCFEREVPQVTKPKDYVSSLH